MLILKCLKRYHEICFVLFKKVDPESKGESYWRALYLRVPSFSQKTNLNHIKKKLVNNDHTKEYRGA